MKKLLLLFLLPTFFALPIPAMLIIGYLTFAFLTIKKFKNYER